MWLHGHIVTFHKVYFYHSIVHRIYILISKTLSYIFISQGNVSIIMILISINYDLSMSK